MTAEQDWLLYWHCPGCREWNEGEHGYRCEHCGMQWAICPNEDCYFEDDCSICHSQSFGLVQLRELVA